MGMARIVWDEMHRLRACLDESARLNDRLAERLAAVKAQAKAWKARTRHFVDLSKHFQKLYVEGQEELDKLRQARARERAEPADMAALDALRKENERLTGLVKAGDEFIHAVRKRVDIDGDLDGTESALDALDDLIARKKGLENELGGCKRTLATAQEDLAQARRTIDTLRLMPKARHDEFGFAKAPEGPDRASLVRYVVRECSYGSSEGKQVMGYGVWDHKLAQWGQCWYEAPGTQSLCDAQARALAKCERQNRAHRAPEMTIEPGSYFEASDADVGDEATGFNAVTERAGPPTPRSEPEPRYEVQEVKDGLEAVIGYMSWDRKTHSAVHRWTLPAYLLNEAEAHALAECERLNG